MQWRDSRDGRSACQSLPGPVDTAPYYWSSGPREGHLALRVRDRQELIDRLQKYGVTTLDLPDNLTPWAQVYCCDPDGNIIEFNVERPDTGT